MVDCRRWRVWVGEDQGAVDPGRVPLLYYSFERALCVRDLDEARLDEDESWLQPQLSSSSPSTSSPRLDRSRSTPESLHERHEDRRPSCTSPPRFFALVLQLTAFDSVPPSRAANSARRA